MNTQLKHLVATASQNSSTDTGYFVPELHSRSRARPGVSRVIDIREWADGQAFPVHILQGKSARTAALPLSFSGRLQYG